MIKNWPETVKFTLLALLSFIFIAACNNPQTNVPQEVGENQRLVEHAYGSTVVPLNPQRVVVLTPSALDNCLALGVKPVGSTFSGFAQREGYGNFPTYIQDRTEGIVNLGHTDRPNLEKILALKPDLIIGSKQAHRSIYKQLSQIAPTVLIPRPSDKNLPLYGEALGKIAEARLVKENFEGRLAEFKEKMGNKLETTQVSVLRFRPDRVRLYQKRSFSGYILDRAGLPRPQAQDKNKSYEVVSIEAISAMDGDVIFYFQDNPDKSMATKIINHPLWSQLEAVKNGRVYEVSFDSWFLGNGMIAANEVLDDLFKYLVQN